MQSKYSLSEKIKREPKLNLNEHGKVDWSQFFRLIPLTNFTDRGIFASRTDGSEKSRVSKSCSCWDRGRQLHYDRLFSNFLHGIATLSQFGWGVLPGWMIHVLGCCRVVSCSQGVQGSPAKEGFRFYYGFCVFSDCVFRIFCIFLTWHDGPRTCWSGASPCHSATRRTGNINLH